MRDSDAEKYFQALKSQEERLEKQDKINVKLELKLRDLLQTDRLYDVIDHFSEKGNFAKVAEVYEIASTIYNLAAVKSENPGFTEWAKKRASLFKEKIPIEQAAISLQHDLRPSLERREGIESHDFRARLEGYQLRERAFSLEIEKPIEEIIQETPISEVSEVIERELKEVVGPSKTKVLNELLFQVFGRLNLSVRMDYDLQMRIGPNIATFRPDIVIFDRSNDLRAIIETVSNLTQRKAEELSLRLVAIKKDCPQVNLFVVFAKATPKAIEFMRPIVDGVYAVRDIQILLDEVRY